MIKVLAACGNGMGSSLIIKMKIEQVLKDKGIDYEIDHCSVGEGKGRASDYDYIFVGEMMKGEFENTPGKTKVIGLQNVLSVDEITEKLDKAMEE